MNNHETVIIEKKNHRLFRDYYPERDLSIVKRDDFTGIGLLCDGEASGAIVCVGEEILSFYVDEKQRRKGYGRELLDMMESKLREKGYEGISCFLAFPDDCRAAAVLTLLDFYQESEGYELYEIPGSELRKFIAGEKNRGKKGIISFAENAVKDEIVSLDAVTISQMNLIEEGLAAEFIEENEKGWVNIAKPLSFVSFDGNIPTALVLVGVWDGRDSSIMWYQAENDSKREGIAVLYRTLERLSQFMEDDAVLSFAAMTEGVMDLCDKIFSKSPERLLFNKRQTCVMRKDF